MFIDGVFWRPVHRFSVFYRFFSAVDWTIVTDPGNYKIRPGLFQIRLPVILNDFLVEKRYRNILGI